MATFELEDEDIAQVDWKGGVEQICVDVTKIIQQVPAEQQKYAPALILTMQTSVPFLIWTGTEVIPTDKEPMFPARWTLFRNLPGEFWLKAMSRITIPDSVASTFWVDASSLHLRRLFSYKTIRNIPHVLLAGDKDGVRYYFTETREMFIQGGAIISQGPTRECGIYASTRPEFTPNALQQLSAFCIKEGENPEDVAQGMPGLIWLRSPPVDPASGLIPVFNCMSAM